MSRCTWMTDGVILLASYAGKYLGDVAFEPLWAELDREARVRRLGARAGRSLIRHRCHSLLSSFYCSVFSPLSCQNGFHHVLAHIRDDTSFVKEKLIERQVFDVSAGHSVSGFDKFRLGNVWVAHCSAPVSHHLDIALQALFARR
jgi:hypothetical protein